MYSYIAKSILSDHLGSSIDPCCTQNGVITNRVIKRLRCMSGSSFSSDHQRRQKTVKLLKQKALDRNPDEFYFNMVNTVKKVGCTCNIYFTFYKLFQTKPISA